MATISIVYDSSVSPTDTNTTNTFRNGKFVYFTSTDLSPSQFYEIGVSCIIRLPTIGGTTDKLWTDLGTLRTNEIITLPSEIADFDYDFYLAFGTEAEIPNLRCYLCSSEVNLESIDSLIRSLEIEIGEVQQQTIDIANNANLQNAAFSLIGTGLVPITGGATAGVPLLFSSTTIPLLF